MGDAAMLLTLVDMLKRISPEASLSALVSDPAFTSEKCPGINAELHGWPWPIPESGRPGVLELLGYPLIFFGNMLTAIAYRIFKARVFLFNKRFSGPLTQLMECDAVVSPGGDFIGPRYFFITSLGEVVMSRIMGKRFILCAQTIGPFDSWIMRKIVAATISLADLVILREERSAAWLRKEGLKHVKVTTDLAFAFGYPQKRKKKSRIIFCPKGVLKDGEGYVEGMVRLARRLADETGCEIVILPTDSHDKEIQSEIASRLDGKASIIGEVLPPLRIAKEIAEAEFIISGRMHAIILGSRSCTPFLALSDSDKFADILGRFYEGGCVAAGADSTDKALGLFRERESLAKKMSAALPELERKALENGRILREFLKDPDKAKHRN